MLYISRIVVVIFVSLWVFSAPVSAQTPTTEWVNFYSENSMLNGAPVPVGAVVTAYDPEGTLCGRSTVERPGSYGFLACYIDDPNTEDVDEGIEPGDKVGFKINGLAAGSYQLPSNIQNGDRFLVDLSASSTSPPSRPDSEPVTVPEPLTVVLFSTGLAGLAALKLRSKNS